MKYYFETSDLKAITRLRDYFKKEKTANVASFSVNNYWGCVSDTFPEPIYNKNSFFDNIRVLHIVMRYPINQEILISGDEKDLSDKIYPSGSALLLGEKHPKD